jgi:hypothetical protein
VLIDSFAGELTAFGFGQGRHCVVFLSGFEVLSLAVLQSFKGLERRGPEPFCLPIFESQ